ncbi:thylakoid lumenal protein [Monoraphidium neglectum]|uniref:Thylakoid lumenal protein n=1 Tax=Monoraphidium neglectum TaxID=145388 RepID=A0A0D2LR49_9CHLO|nr:thylakoid lumenal protein [Monoraphidium neglectum]KIY94134.1 thylakoid lumenal protein [Monoraphidium neglectum]|eukprot:XP_013893154.1 thylakoid lumenal protein [Monoraphidium neglectum]
MALRIANAPTAAGRRSVTCRAAAPQPAAPGRRAALGALLGAASLALAAPRRALALIPDEEDEELLERAKANRAARLQKNQEVTRAFIKEEGLTNKQLDSELIPVQKAITKLAQSGSQLEADDVKAASSTLNGDWVDDFKKASTVLSTTDAAKGATTALFDGIAGLRKSAGKGDIKATKQQYVAVVGSLQKWADAAGVAGNLKGL